MADQVLTSAAPATVASTAANGNQTDQFFAPQMEEALVKAYAEAKPDQFKMPKISAEVQPSSTTGEEPGETERSTQPAEKPNKPAGAPEVKPPAKAAQWKEVNEERARLKAENEAFKTEQEKWKTWETERKEQDTIKKRNDELTKVIREVALDRLPEFRKHFDDRRNTAIAVGQQIVGADQSETLKKIAQLPDGDFRNQLARQLMEGLDEFQKAELGPVLADIRKINFERQAALEQAPEQLKLYEQVKERERRQQAEQFEGAFQSALSKWSDPEKGLALFQKKDGDQTHNAEVDQRVATARNIINMNLSADQLSKAALWSASAPGLLKDLLASREREKTLTAELESLKAGGPDLSGSGNNQLEVDDEKQYEGMSMGEIVAKKVAKAGGWQR